MPRAMREGMEGTPQGHRRDMCEVPGEGAVMPRSASTRSTAVAALHVVPQLGHETLYLGIDVGKAQHVAGFVSRTLLARYQRFESCPALTFAQSREGLRALAERIREYVPLTQVYVLLEVTGHYHRGLVQYLHELDIPVYLMHVQKRQPGLLKSDKRDALGLANHLYNILEKGAQSGDPLQAVRRLVPPTAAAAQLAGMIHHREELVRERTQRKNQLTAICDELFPEFTQVCKDPNAASALALRSAFPTPAALATASMSALFAARQGRHPANAKLLDVQRLAAESIGTQDLARIRGLNFEQAQLIAELQLIERHVGALDAELAQTLATSREGRILTSIPGIGAIPAATILAASGSIANFDRPAQLKADCGWAPMLTQSGTTVDRARLAPRGVRLLKHTIYLATWQALSHPDNEFARLYARLVPCTCAFDERTGQRVGKNTVVGRVAGQLITVLFTLLKRDQEVVAQAQAKGTPLPEPTLYDPALHRRHRSGQYQATIDAQPGAIVRLPLP
jgi:transposase